MIISWDRDREDPLVSVSCKLGWWYSDVPRMGVMQKFKSHLKEKTNQNQKSGYSFSLPGLSYCLLALTQGSSRKGHHSYYSWEEKHSR